MPTEVFHAVSGGDGSGSASSPGPVQRLMSATGLRVLEMDPRQAPDGEGLMPEERGPVARAVEKRRRQYTAGRLLSRQLLQEWDHGDHPLVPDADRVPTWPTGLVGCITHTDIWCAAVVGRSAAWRGLGIDVEPATPLSEPLHASVCRAEELQWLSERSPTERGLLAKAIFSAKESIYKALFPEVREFLGFEGMRIELTRLKGTDWQFTAELQRPWGTLQPGARFEGGLASLAAPLVTTAIALQHPGRSAGSTGGAARATAPSAPSAIE